MKYIFFLFIITNFYSCNNHIVIKRKSQIKVLKIAILEAQKSGFVFNGTQYEIEYLNWYKYLDKCNHQELKILKSCIIDLEYEWDVFYKYKLKKKSNYFWYIRIYSYEFSEFKINPKYFYVFWISPETNKIILKYHDNNYKSYKD